MKKERVTVKLGKEYAKNVDILNKDGKIIASIHVFQDGSIFVNKFDEVLINDKYVESSKLEWNSINYEHGCNWHVIKSKEENLS